MLKVANSIINASQIATPITLPGDVTLSTGNLVIGTAGKGIDFSVTSSGSGTMTSELLADYEEGTWTPQIYYQNGTDQAAATNGTQVGTYVKVGNIVTVNCYLTWTISTSPVNDNIGVKNLPFTQANIADNLAIGAAQIGNAGSNPATTWVIQGVANFTYVFIDDGTGAGNFANEIGGTGTKSASFTLTYRTT